MCFPVQTDYLKIRSLIRIAFLFAGLALLCRERPVFAQKYRSDRHPYPLSDHTAFLFQSTEDAVPYPSDLPWPSIIPESRVGPFPDSLVLSRFSYHWLLYYDVYTTLSAFHYLHSNSATEVNNIYFYYNIDLKSNLSFRQVKWDFYLFNDYGLRHFIDSITLKTQDQLTWKNSLYYPIYRKKLYASLQAQTQTKLWNTHEYRNSLAGTPEPYLYDGYMSPGVITYSGGLTYEAPGNSILQLGLGSSKVTKIRNQDIFESRQETRISGLDKGQRKKAEWGFQLTATVPMQKLHRMLRWEFFGNAFAPANQLKNTDYYTLDINQVIHIILLKYMRLSFRTKLAYNRDVFPKPRIQNHISLGFYLTNQL